MLYLLVSPIGTPSPKDSSAMCLQPTGTLPHGTPLPFK